jgi:hypothetical protein
MQANNLPESVAYDTVPVIQTGVPFAPILINTPPRTLRGFEKINERLSFIFCAILRTPVHVAGRPFIKVLIHLSIRQISYVVTRLVRVTLFHECHIRIEQFDKDGLE